MSRMRKESRRKRRIAPVPEPSPEPIAQAIAQSSDDAPRASEPSDASASTERVGIAFKGDKIDTDAMRSATRERLRIALQDETLFERLGIASPAAATTPDDAAMETFYTQAVSIVHDALFKLWAAQALRAGYPTDQVRQILMTPEEHAMLDPLAAAAANEWLPKVDSKYQSLYMLGLGYFAVANAKLGQLRKPATVLPFEVKPPENQPS